MTNALIDIPEEIHKRLKILSAIQNKKLKEIIIDALGSHVFISEPLDGSFSDWMRDLNDNTNDDEYKNLYQIYSRGL